MLYRLAPNIQHAFERVATVIAEARKALKVRIDVQKGRV
jgi:hypothetical protein